MTPDSALAPDLAYCLRCAGQAGGWWPPPGQVMAAQARELSRQGYLRPVRVLQNFYVLTDRGRQALRECHATATPDAP